MNDPAIHVWTGASGQKYRYADYMFGTAFGPGPANCILARETHVHVKFSTAADEVRRAERSDLIAQWIPPCNSTR